MGLFKKDHHHHYHKETVNVPYEKEVTINEHRAVTDESIKILNEMEEKAKNNIIHKVKIEHNHLKAVAVYYQDDMIQDRLHCQIKFELNGNEFLIEDYIDNAEWRNEFANHYGGFGYEYILKLVYRRFSEAIAKELLKQSHEFTESIKSKS